MIELFIKERYPLAALLHFNQSLYAKLTKGGKNWRLEQLRRAKNAYYRLFNDGDYNQLFDNALKELPPLMGYRSLCPRNIDRVMNLKIKRAWNEQFVNL